DPMPEYEEALRGYQRATELDPQYLYAWSNQADLYATMAEYDVQIGVDPRPAVDGAQRAAERGLAVDPNFYSLLDTVAEANLTLAQYLVDSGGDPGLALDRARDHLARADAIQPGHMVTWFYRLVAAGTDARRRLRDGADPTSSIAVARAALREVLR